MSIFSPDDLVFYKENDTIMSGGYLIDSILLKKGVSPIHTRNQYGGYNSDNNNNNNNNNNNTNNTKVSNIFENLAVPAGLLYTYSKGNIMQHLNNSHKQGGSIVLDDEIHDDFMQKIQMDFHQNKNKNKNRKTKKQKQNTNNNSKKYNKM